MLFNLLNIKIERKSKSYVKINNNYSNVELLKYIILFTYYFLYFNIV